VESATREDHLAVIDLAVNHLAALVSHRHPRDLVAIAVVGGLMLEGRIIALVLIVVEAFEFSACFLASFLVGALNSAN